MDNPEKIEKTIAEGHLVASKIKSANSVSDIDNLSDEIKKYCDFVNESFGTLNDLNDEKECDLSAMLYMAAEEKARQLEYYPGKDEAGNEDIIDFENMLDSKIWVKDKK